MSNKKVATSSSVPGLMPRRLPVLLRRAWYGMNQAFRRRIAHTGSTPDQYTALRYLTEVGEGGLTQAELTQRMSSDPNTIASLLLRMERLGLVIRRADPGDRRVRRVLLNALGSKRYEELHRIAVALQKEILGNLRPGERDSFLEQLERVANGCREAVGR